MGEHFFFCLVKTLQLSLAICAGVTHCVYIYVCSHPTLTTNDIREEIFDATGRLKLYFAPSSCYSPPQKGKKNEIEMFYFYSCLNKGALPGSQCSGDKPGCFSRELGAEAPQARMEEGTLSAHPILAGFSKYKG